MLTYRTANSFMRLQSYSFAIPARIILLILTFIIFGCKNSSDENSEIRFEWRIQPEPPRVGMATIHISLKDSTEQSISGADIELEGNMSHPGMRPVMATAEEVAPGEYEAPIEFTMAGQWFILVESTLADGKVIERQINIPQVRSE